jgi:ribonuclease HI
MPDVYIYADESCLGNGRRGASPGGAAGLVATWTGTEWARRDFWISEPDTTNNRMAIRSGIVPLSALTRPCHVIFVSDSQYLVQGMTAWVFGWMRRNWQRKTGPVENVELWKELVSAAGRHQVEWRWVRGHAGHPQNEYANDLAIRAARSQSNSAGLEPSGFVEWLEAERQKGRYNSFDENAPPPAEGAAIPARRS